MTTRVFLALWLTLFVSFQIKGQQESYYYSDQNYLNKVKHQTSFKREFFTTPDSIVSKTYYKDSLKTEGVYFGFKTYKEIAPFEIYYRSQKLIKLKNLKLDHRKATITSYEKNIKSELVKFENESTLVLQRWVDGKPMLKNGYGLIEIKYDKNTSFEEYEDYVRLSAYSVRTEEQDTLYSQIDKAAVPPGGDIYGFQKEIKTIFKYPKKARRKGLQTVVHLVFVIDKSGNLTEISVLNRDSLNQLFVELIEKGSELLSRWEPAYFDGKPVKTLYQVKIEYILK